MVHFFSVRGMLKVHHSYIEAGDVTIAGRAYLRTLRSEEL